MYFFIEYINKKSRQNKMSSDDAILVWNFNNKYYVWHAQGEFDFFEPPYEESKKLSTRCEALIYAHDLVREIRNEWGYVEYGVNELEPAKRDWKITEKELKFFGFTINSTSREIIDALDKRLILIGNEIDKIKDKKVSPINKKFCAINRGCWLTRIISFFIYKIERLGDLSLRDYVLKGRPLEVTNNPRAWIRNYMPSSYTF